MVDIRIFLPSLLNFTHSLGVLDVCEMLQMAPSKGGREGGEEGRGREGGGRGGKEGDRRRDGWEGRGERNGALKTQFSVSTLRYVLKYLIKHPQVV